MTDRPLRSPHHHLTHVLLALLGLGAVPAGCGSEPSEPPPPVVTLTKTADMDPEVVSLIQEHVQRVEADPGNYELRGDLGLAYEANNMFREAEQSYAQAAAMADDEMKQHEWLYKVSLMKRRNGDLPGALDLMRQVADKFKKTTFVLIRMGDMLVESDDLAAAEKAYGRAAELAPQDPYARVRLAHVLLQTERTDEAIEILEQVVAEVPQYKAAHFRLGQAYQTAGRAEDAKRELQLGVDSVPGYPPDAFDERLAKKAAGYGLRMGRVENMIAGGNFKDAFAELESIRADRPEDIMVLNLSAKAHAAAGEFAQALEWLDRSLEVDATGYAAHMLYAEYAAFAQQFDVALSHADRAVELAPEQGMAHFRRGWVLLFSGELDEALEAFRTAEDKGCQDPNLYLNLAQAYGRKEMFPAALKYAKLAVQKMPQYLGAQITLAQAALSAGDVQTGHTAFLAAEALAPADPMVLELKNIFASMQDQQPQ